MSSPALLGDARKLIDNYVARTGHPIGHLRDWLDGIRTRRRCVANEVVAHRTMGTNLVMDICMDLRRGMKWDPAKEEFVGDPDANRLRSRPMRAPWAL